MSELADLCYATTAFAEAAPSGPLGEVLAFNRRLNRTVRSLGDDAPVMPTPATSHIPADHDDTTDSTEIEGHDVHPLTGWILTPLFNLLDTYPVLSVPTGRTGRGMPTGMQIVARPYDDLTAFRVAGGSSSAATAMFTADRLPDFRTGGRGS